MPVNPPAPPRPPPSPPDPEWLSDDDLGGDKDYEDIVLPVLRRRVRVRFLTTLDVTGLSHLPDLAEFHRLVLEFDQRREQIDEKGTTALEGFSTAQLWSENLRYQMRLAHIAVVHPDRDIGGDVECADCGLRHPPSLLSVKRAERLDREDLAHISAVAIQKRLVAQMVPFSDLKTATTSPSPVSSGE